MLNKAPWPVGVKKVQSQSEAALFFIKNIFNSLNDIYIFDSL